MKLMDLFEFMPKSKLSASYGSDKGNYPFFTSSNTIDKYCDDFIYDGEFLIIGDGGTGNCKHYNGKFSVSDHNYVLKPKSQTNALAVKYFLEKDNYQILNYGFKGIGIKNVSKSYIQNIDYKYNQNFSQNEIVKNLVLIEKNIEREKQSINSLDCLIKSRFIEMFGKKITDNSAICKFEDICTGIIGLTYKPENIQNEGTIVLRSGNIQNNQLQLEDDVVRVDTKKIDKKKIIHDLDILMCSRNGSSRLVGKTCLIRNPKEEMTWGAFMMVIRTEFPYILQTFMCSDYFKIQLTTTQTASVNQITNGMLREYQVFKPTLDDETEFSKFVKLVDKLKFINKR